jgi:hypothetical protein
MTPNQKRARQARCALRAYGRNRQVTRKDSVEPAAYTEETITDLIADLYHYAQSENVDVEAVARQAMAHFKAEQVADLSDRTIPD